VQASGCGRPVPERSGFHCAWSEWWEGSRSRRVVEQWPGMLSLGKKQRSSDCGGRCEGVGLPGPWNRAKHSVQSPLMVERVVWQTHSYSIVNT